MGLHDVLVIIEYVLAAFVAVMFLVITHECGHFIAARLAGVKAPEFFVGFGPRIWSTRRGDTEFGIKWILVGGYVKVLGMNPEEEVSPEDFPHSYKGVSYGKRFWIIFSGSLVHILLALLIMFFTIWLIGYPDFDRETNTLASVGQYLTQEEILADISGLQKGDTILAIDEQEVSDWEDVRSYIQEHNGEDVTLLIERDGQRMEVQVMLDVELETPAYAAGLEKGDTILATDGQEVSDWDEVLTFIKEHPGEEVTLLIERDGREIAVKAQLATLEDGSGYLGVSPSPYMVQYSFLGAAGKTGEWFLDASWGVFYGIYRAFNLSSFKQLLGLSEPTVERPQSVLGVTRTAGQIAGQGAFYFLYFFAFICLFLAYINLAPLPPLDGGHLAVLVWEKLTGREVDMRKLYPVAMAVLLVLGVLVISAFIQDIVNPINLP